MGSAHLPGIDEHRRGVVLPCAVRGFAAPHVPLFSCIMCCGVLPCGYVMLCPIRVGRAVWRRSVHHVYILQRCYEAATILPICGCADGLRDCSLCCAH